MSILHKIFTKEHLRAFLNWLTDGLVDFVVCFIWAFFGAILLAVMSGAKIEKHLIDNVLSPQIGYFILTLFLLWVTQQICGFVLSKILGERNGSTDNSVEPGKQPA